MFRGVFGECTTVLLLAESNDSLREPVHLSFVVPPPRQQPQLKTAALSSRPYRLFRWRETDSTVSLCLPWALQHKRAGEGWVKIRAVSLSRSRHASVRSKCRGDSAHLPDNYVHHSASWLRNRPGHKTIWHLPNTEAHTRTQHSQKGFGLRSQA